MERALPTRWSTTVFNVKAALLKLRRLAADLRDGVRRCAKGAEAEYPVRLAESRTALWASVATHDLGLQRGKVQNLRAAAARIDGVTVPAHALWSFWKHVGRATAGRGFAEGRMLREGCVVPTVGGGLCQLSNALFEVAAKAGCEIVERHRHSQILPGSAAAAGRDATVVWNYIDFRFRPRQHVLLRVTLSADELVVGLYGRARAQAREQAPEAATPPPTAGDCTTCSEWRCFRKAAGGAPSTAETHAAWLLDVATAELAAYVRSTAAPPDLICAPLDGARWGKPQYAWPAPAVQAPLEVVLRSLHARRLSRYGARRLEADLAAARRLARAFARRLSADATHLSVSQSLLPFLWLDGVLGGRTFDVLMTRTPLARLHVLLDEARARYPESRTLGEFRAPEEIVAAETRALAHARRGVTAHRGLAAEFGDRAVTLDWHSPRAAGETVDAIGFCGPTAARKGAYAVREAMGGSGRTLWVAGPLLEGDDFWGGVDIRRVSREEVLRCRTILAPSLLEDDPRHLLGALAAGRRVVATEACGLAPQAGLVRVPFGDVDALRGSLK
jgi:hypothetical protein